MCLLCAKTSHAGQTILASKAHVHSKIDIFSEFKETRRWFLLLGAALYFGRTKSVKAQIPGATPVSVGSAPDGDKLIPEFVTSHPGMLGGLAGLATLFQGTAVILYDPGWIGRMGGLGSNGFRFIRAHEYAQHRLSHGMKSIAALSQGFMLFDYINEVEADCWAAGILRSQGDTAAIQAGVHMYASVLPPFDIQGRPGAQVRLQNISRCSM